MAALRKGAPQLHRAGTRRHRDEGDIGHGSKGVGLCGRVAGCAAVWEGVGGQGGEVGGCAREEGVSGFGGGGEAEGGDSGEGGEEGEVR